MFMFINVRPMSRCRPPILNLDHNVVYWIPVYRSKLKKGDSIVVE